MKDYGSKELNINMSIKISKELREDFSKLIKREGITASTAIRRYMMSYIKELEKQGVTP